MISEKERKKILTPAYTYAAIVHSVVDGDTVKATIDLGFGVLLKDRKVRLLGINAPERNEAAGTAATLALAKLIDSYAYQNSQQQKVLLIETELDRNDKYGRILAKLIGVDQTGKMANLNLEMLLSGHGEEYK